MRCSIAALMLLALAPSASAAEDFPYDAAISFAAFRNGQNIGQHTLKFERSGSQLTVSTSIELSVKVLGFTAYRYSHAAQEFWSAGTFLGLAARTDDNGKKSEVKVRRDGDRLEVERSVGQAIPAAAPLERPLGINERDRTILPSELLPTTHWNVRQTRQSALINTQTGTQARITVAVVGTETILAANTPIEATRYRYTGDVVMDQWFDGKGRWVKTSFVASDGSVIEYVLQ